MREVISNSHIILKFFRLKGTIHKADFYKFSQLIFKCCIFAIPNHAITFLLNSFNVLDINTDKLENQFK